MVENLANWIEVLFGLTVLLTIWLYWLANPGSGRLIGWTVLLGVIHSVAAYLGFYSNFEAIPPRFLLIIIPSTLIVLYGLLPSVRKKVMDNRDLYLSPFLHVIRVPVEIVLLYLFYHGAIPELMTFEGRNFDILAGITAPIMGALYVRNKVSNTAMIAWNITCLGLVSFILTNGILSAPLPFQLFAFDQPNVGVAYFPFVLLPAIIVPIVMYTHIIDLLILIKALKEK